MLDLRLKNFMVTNGGQIFQKGLRFFSFFPHKCGCGHISKSEKEAKYIGKMDDRQGGFLYMFNCPNCKTTFSKQSEKLL